MIPFVIFEDEHLLVVNKPAGWNTHAPSPYAGEGIYDWLRHREPRWASLAIIHRLDKETSGVMVFGKTALANRSLTEQFEQRRVLKKYRLLTDWEPKQREFTVKSKIVRAGESYRSSAHGEIAETKFVAAVCDRRQFPEPPAVTDRRYNVLEASPLTGRTHQIRVHAAESGLPILGDTLYGGTPWARVCLHAAELSFRHPATGEDLTFLAPVDFNTDPRAALREAIIEPEQTNAYRLIHGASDGWPDWYVDRLGDFLLSQSERALTQEQAGRLAEESPSRGLTTTLSPSDGVRVVAKGAYHKILTREVRRASTGATLQVSGEAAPERFVIRENGVRFELSFEEGYSVGLFLDQRDNRRRFLTGEVAADFPLFRSALRVPRSAFNVLNAFAYTCGFSVCAALAGARTTSLDLSKKYLDWGKRNFVLNGLDPAGHDFIHGDVFDWLRRLAKRGLQFDVIALDPPTFSQSKEHGVFRAEKDYGKLVSAALPLLRLNGVLFASTNAATLKPETFLKTVTKVIPSARRNIIRQHFVPQPPDFPVTRAEPGYLKTVWIKIA